MEKNNKKNDLVKEDKVSEENLAKTFVKENKNKEKLKNVWTHIDAYPGAINIFGDKEGKLTPDDKKKYETIDDFIKDIDELLKQKDEITLKNKDKKAILLGALSGDINGSKYEFINSPKTKDFDLFDKDMEFTDDSVLTIGVAETLLRHLPVKEDEQWAKSFKDDLVDTFCKLVKKYPGVGWGSSFYQWAHKTNPTPYGSWGNGSAMRISPVGWIANSEKEVKYLNKLVCEITHNHKDAIKGAEAIAIAIFMAKNGSSKEDIYKRMISYYPEIQYMDYEFLKEKYVFDVSCKGTVPYALFAFFISNSFEDCLRTAVTIGGDCDTLSCIACSVAEAFYKEHAYIFKDRVFDYCGDNFIDTIYKFSDVVLN